MRRILGGLVEDIAAQRSESSAWRTSQEQWRSNQDAWRGDQEAARKRGQRRTLYAALILALVQLAGLLIVVWIAATLRAHGL
jgi:hypothetical protein